MKKFLTFFMVLFIVEFCFAENNRTIYQSGVYGQSFYLVEYKDGDKCRLLLVMKDNKNSNEMVKKGYSLDFYDSKLPTNYYIWSKWFTNPSEYSDAIQASEQFFDISLDFVYLKDLKDICDIASCCTSIYYGVSELNNKEKYIHIEYDCSDLELFFEIASMYTSKGRDYVMQKYSK